MNDLKLIQLVKEHPLLYNSSAENYDCNIARHDTWKKIAKIMALPIRRCKRRWVVIRNYYIRSLRSKTAIKKKGIPKSHSCYSEMEFLKPFLKSYLKPYLKPKLYEKLPNFYTHDVQTSTHLSNTATEDTNLNDTNDERLRFESISTINTSSDSLQTQQPYIIGSTSLAKEFANIKQFETRDVLMKYFETIADTVREFPPTLQVKVKSEISNIVHQAEMEHAHQIQMQSYGQLINGISESEQVPFNNVITLHYTVGDTLTKVEHPI